MGMRIVVFADVFVQYLPGSSDRVIPISTIGSPHSVHSRLKLQILQVYISITEGV